MGTRVDRNDHHATPGDRAAREGNSQGAGDDSESGRGRCRQKVRGIGGDTDG